jgi:hypothetical protein
VPDLPAPLPPDQRTVGQLIAETIRAYGSRFWPALLLGLPVALADQFSVRQPASVQMFIYWAATPLFVAAYIRAVNMLYGAAATLAAVAVAVLIYLPFPALRAVFILPGLAWFAFIGLAVPAAMIEKLSFREALVRGRQLGVADYVHSLGSLAALVIVVGVADSALSALLHTQSDNGVRVALFLADLVLSPLLFLGSALLYTDQAARVGSRTHNGRSRRNADLHPPVDADAAGHSDPQVES